MLNSCTGNNLAYYKDTTPKADIKEYFNGPIKAWGIVQDWRGRVVSRFDVSMQGTWEGDVGTLQEDFRYYNGKQQQRVWTIKNWLTAVMKEPQPTSSTRQAAKQKAAQYAGITCSTSQSTTPLTA